MEEYSHKLTMLEERHSELRGQIRRVDLSRRKVSAAKKELVSLSKDIKRLSRIIARMELNTYNL